MTEQVTIARRFCGPVDSANGGYACGLVAGLVDAGPATVRLHSPPPLETPIDVERSDGEVGLLHEGELVAQGRAAERLEFEPPPLPGIEQARSSTLAIASEDHAYPTCFVCGPARTPPDGLGVYAGPVTGRDDGLIATTWTPDPSLAADDGRVEDVYIWSVLDCPTGNVAFFHWENTTFLLGELTASIDAPVETGVEYVLAAWPLERDGRKYHTAMAIADPAGEIVARSKAIWISV